MGCLTNNYCVPDWLRAAKAYDSIQLTSTHPVSGHFSHYLPRRDHDQYDAAQKNDSLVRVPRQRTLVLVMIMCECKADANSLTWKRPTGLK